MNDIDLDSNEYQSAIVALSNVSKHFGALKALNHISIRIEPGECIGLVGHNGAGKSTLVKIINGRLKPTDGSARYQGIIEKISRNTNAEIARKLGIRSVFQELSLCANLTVLENLRIPYKEMSGRGWRKAAKTRVLNSLNSIFPGHGINPLTTVSNLTIAERQMVEIAIAFSERDIPPSLVILDEPTSSLDSAIAAQLLDHIKRFCKTGGAVIFITHMLGEIFEVASRIVVMKDGTITKDDDLAFFTRQSLVDAMGHVVSQQPDQAQKQGRELGDVILRTPDGLSARQNEIVGLAGLAGHGQAEALAAFYIGKTSFWRAPKKIDVAFVAGDRTRDGVMPLWSIMKNLSLKTLTEFSGRFLVDRKREAELALQWQNKIGIRTNDTNNPILSLSGGNQQKVLFAKALASGASIVVMDDPMRGVDVGTKKDVYEMIRQEAANGRTFLWYSTEIDEVCECDRVFVYRDGMISAELIGSEITEENILKASFEMQDSAA